MVASPIAEDIWRDLARVPGVPRAHELTIGGDPIYTELLTCLELQRDARMLREKERATEGRW